MASQAETGNGVHCILLVDDEQNILFALKRELHQWAHDRNVEILTALSAKEGLSILEKRHEAIDVIVSDLRMPEMKGSDFLLEVKQKYPSIITLLLTGYSETGEIVKSVSAGIFSYMLKPWDSGYLLAEISKAWDYAETRKQNALHIQRMEDELKWAGEMQKTILRPNLPATDKIEFRVSYRPVPGLYCGGDYYDVISVGPDRYLILIGDVAGHGVQAAFVTGILKAVIYPEYIRNVIGSKISPSDFLGWLNQRMHFEFRSTNSMLVSFFAGLLDLREGSFVYANAGHCHPCVIMNGAVTELPVAGTALGVARSVMYNEQLLAVHPNDLLVFYTDGLSEVGKGVQVPALLAKVQQGPDYHLRMLEAALQAAGASQFVDDVTVLTARIN